jgi:hypothetical protein
MRRFMKFLGMHFSTLVTAGIIILLFCTSLTIIEQEKKRTDEIANMAGHSTEQLNNAVDVLIEVYYEEKHLRKICEEMVDRWANDDRTRQEVKNEARRLKERAKKKGVKK